MKTESENFIFGRHPVMEAVQQNREIDKIYLADNIRGEFEKEVRQIVKEKNIPLSKVPQARLNQMSNRQNHQGIMAFVSAVEYQDLEAIISKTFDEGRH
ncbi:MAG TPA: RNA methyltransferase substrate-binding domain-containing protein, partial [Saprospiraceae bacterium]|nr:RNA methyltransferase substrate-binding domain-containing protein [Saprospiraceae bacterium]